MKARLFSLIAIAAMFLSILSGCGNNEPIKIGLAVELTGKQADVGINIRDAALMAVDEINASGGVDGRLLELLVRDDQGKPEVARQVDQELVDAGVVAIIGHYTSGQTMAVFDQMNRAGVILISPTASSSDFSYKADYFFRMISDTAFIGGQFAKHIYADHSIQKLVGIYDDNNRSYAKSYWDAASAAFEAQGGTTQVFVFKSGETDLKELAMQIRDASPDGILTAASSVDTAVIAQYVRQLGVNAPLFTSPWAQTSQLIEKGGRAVEGLEVSAFYNQDNQRSEHLVFVEKFQKRFGRSTQLGTSQSYECVLVLAEALKATDGKAEGLQDALYAIQDFPGILGLISFDEYGDVHRDVYIVQIKDGAFVTVHTLSSDSE